MGLRAVPDESDPLSRNQLQDRGNELLKVARDAALDALRASTKPDIFNRGGTFSIAEVKELRRQADAAVAAWAVVAGALAELVNEHDRTRTVTSGRGTRIIE